MIIFLLTSLRVFAHYFFGHIPMHKLFSIGVSIIIVSTDKHSANSRECIVLILLLFFGLYTMYICTLLGCLLLVFITFLNSFMACIVCG